MIAVLAPPLTTKSAGIIMLHSLIRGLNDLNIPSILVTYRGIGSQYEVSVDGITWHNPKSINEVVDNIEIIIIPEVISADSLPERANIGRYYLNKSGAIVPDVVFRESEYRIAFEPFFVDEPNFILWYYLGKVPIDSAHSDQETDRFINATYFGKLENKYSTTPPLPSSILITRQWPEKTEQYLQILKSSEYLFSFDSCSSTNTDAIICGAKLVLLDFDCLDKMSLGQCMFPIPFLCAENYSDPSAVTDYFAERKNWINDLRKNQEQFEKNVKLLVEDLYKFFMTTIER
jgi:hypothetical protein